MSSHTLVENGLVWRQATHLHSSSRGPMVFYCCDRVPPIGLEYTPGPSIVTLICAQPLFEHF